MGGCKQVMVHLSHPSQNIAEEVLKRAITGLGLSHHSQSLESFGGSLNPLSDFFHPGQWVGSSGSNFSSPGGNCSPGCPCTGPSLLSHAEQTPPHSPEWQSPLPHPIFSCSITSPLHIHSASYFSAFVGCPNQLPTLFPKDIQL